MMPHGNRTVVVCAELVVASFPDGRFYTLIPDRDDLARVEQRLWGERRSSVPSIDFDWEGQAALLEAVRGFAPEYDYPEEAADAAQFREANPFFPPRPL